MVRRLTDYKILVIVLSFLVLISFKTANATAQATGTAQGAAAEKFIDTLGKDAIGVLSSKKHSRDAKKKKLSKILNSKFDIKTIARFALGKHWRRATAEQKKEYLSLFNKMIINTYTGRLGEYKGQVIKVKGHSQKNKDILVRSEIEQEDGPSLKIDWRVRYKKSKYMVIDVVVEDISMTMTQRSDFSSIIQRGGGKIDALLKSLKEHNK